MESREVINMINKENITLYLIQLKELYSQGVITNIDAMVMEMILIHVIDDNNFEDALNLYNNADTHIKETFLTVLKNANNSDKL